MGGVSLTVHNYSSSVINSDITISDLIQSASASSEHQHGDHCPTQTCDIDNVDDQGNPFPDEQTQCTVNCSAGNHGNHYQYSLYGGNSFNKQATEVTHSGESHGTVGISSVNAGGSTTTTYVSYDCINPGHTCKQS